MRRHPRPATRQVESWLEEPNRPLRALPTLVHHALSTAAHVLPTLTVVAAGVLALVMAGARVRRWRLARGARLVRIGIPPEVQPQGALLLWSALHDLLLPNPARLLTGQPHLSWEISASEQGTVFRLWVPRVIPLGLIERAIASAWPGASTSIEPVPFTPARAVQHVSELVIAGPDWFALDTGIDPDPLRVILGQLSGLHEGENALVQVLARPATAREQHRLRMAARRLRGGIPTGRAARAFELLSPNPPRRTTLDPTINPDVRDVLDKSAGPLYRSLIRIAVSAPSRALARGRLAGVIGGFAPYEGRAALRRRSVRRAPVKLHGRWLTRGAFTVSIAELAALAHLPADAAIPGLVRASAREVSSPPGISAGAKPLGVTSSGRRVGIAVADARQHIHVLGPTGVGKSTLIAQLALSDFRTRRGAVVIDPKGDLVDDLLARIPPGDEDNVDLFNPSDPAPLTLNMLDNPDRDLGVDQLVSVFRRVFERDWGPRTDDIFRSALLTLTATVPAATLADVPRLLSDAEWRAPLIAQINDPVGLGPFWDWYQELSDSGRSQAVGPLLNKLRAFLLRRPVRQVVARPKTTLDIPGALNDGRLLLARLPKGTLGEDTSRLLGSMIVARAWQAAQARATLAPEGRPDCSLYVDEVHNYLSLPTPIDEVLAEARGYRISFCLAHQHLAQLTPELRAGIDANARTKVYFQLSQDDAHHLERELAPELSEYDLANLPRYTAAARVVHDGQPSRPFTLTTEDLPPAEPGRAETVRAILTRRARTQYEPQATTTQRHSAKPLERRARRQRSEPQKP
jgi:Helicase HerA, central domain